MGFVALANMLGLGEGFAQMLMILTLILLAVVAFRFFAARKSGAICSICPALLPLSRLRMPTLDKAEAKLP